MKRFLLVILLLLNACSGGAVIFAPTPAPPDQSPARYTHPSGAFSIDMPRGWSVYEQNLTTLAAASFAAPDDLSPALSVAVVNLGDSPDSASYAEVINAYQFQIRPDLGRYVEQDRQAMGDGSWRIVGLRTSAAGIAQPVNTFIERSGALLAVIDIVLPDVPARFDDIQRSVNTFTINASSTLQPANVSALSAAHATSLQMQNISTWTTRDGVLFITGEVANFGLTPVSAVPVRAVLWRDDGVGVAEAVDTAMGYTILPGGFAPFSLRFGQGQPPGTTLYTVSVGGENGQSDDAIPVNEANALTWTDQTGYTQQGGLVIYGTVTNTSSQPLRNLQATATVFNAEKYVIAAGFSDLATAQLDPQQSVDYQVVIPEMGGTAANYILSIQGLP